uniref:TIL domain-containing protein n=1 Tax=Caenorhabditis tropicalis TaxID=1561998 RepID=A0A1I7T3M2_9PELO
MKTFSCSKTEIYNCLDCEPTCHNLVPKCRKEQCNKGCVCKNGLARNSEGKCVTLRECAAQSPPKNDSVRVEEEDGTVMKTVKKMVPVIVNDVWKALFNSISTPDSQGSANRSTTKDVIKPILTPVDSGSKNININLTGPVPTEVKDEKQPQKGFYIDYP